jgi:hypothetical protein
MEKCCFRSFIVTYKFSQESSLFPVILCRYKIWSLILRKEEVNVSYQTRTEAFLRFDPHLATKTTCTHST